MPYVEKHYRKYLNKVVQTMEEYSVEANGDLNYILFKFCKYHIEPSYNNYKNFIGELNECVAEIRRRLLAPYEDLKRQENGDIE